MDNNEIKRKLGSVNWNFDFDIAYSDDSPHPFNCREFYSYPATFIPEIPYALIEILSKKGDTVIDPFGGIGTTFMQALLLEREPYSYDINPVASQVCETLFELFNPHVDLSQIRDRIVALCNDYDENVNYTDLLSEPRKELSGWFEEKTFNQVAFLIHRYTQEQNPLIRDVLNLIISSLLVTLSSQNKGWAYIADNVKPKPDELREKPVFDYYKQSVKRLFATIESQRKLTSDSFDTFYSRIASQKRVFTQSILDSNLEAESINLIITSPPYPKMIDYVKSQRLVFSYSEKSFKDYTEFETGARYRRARRNALLEYETSINEINIELFRILKTQGFLCVVLPDYDVTDDRKSTIDKVISEYEKHGLKKIYEIGRYIPSNKRTLSIQWATLVNERIIIYQKR